MKGILCILTSAFGFALMAFFVRLCDDCGGFVSSFQKSFFRNAIALVLATAAFVAVRRRAGAEGVRLPRGREWWVLVGRSVAGTVGIFANFYALSHIPIGEAMTLNKTAPFFTVFFSWLLLGERMSMRQFGALVLAFGGALLVMKPTLSGVSLPAGAALLGGLGAGLAYVCVHRLGRSRVNAAFIVLFFSAFSCLSSLPFMIVDPAPMTLKQLFVLLGAGVGAAIGQFGITAAYRYAEPRRIAVFDYSNVIFTAALGLVFLGQVPDVLSSVGFAVILAAAIFSRPVAATRPGDRVYRATSRSRLRIALTGGIACGKSLVARDLNELGVETIDADDIVHELLPDPAERKRIAAEVFADPAKRRALEARLHPQVKERINAFLRSDVDVASPADADLADASPADADLADASPVDANFCSRPLRIAVIPLLFETGWDKDYDIVCCVTSARETQIARMISTRGYTRAEAEARLAAQMPVAEKAARSRFVLANDGSADDLKREVARLVAELRTETQSR